MIDQVIITVLSGLPPPVVQEWLFGRVGGVWRPSSEGSARRRCAKAEMHRHKTPFPAPHKEPLSCLSQASYGTYLFSKGARQDLIDVSLPQWQMRRTRAMCSTCFPSPSTP